MFLRDISSKKQFVGYSTQMSVPIGIIPVTDFKIKMKPGTWVKEYCRTKGMFSFWHHGIVSEVDKHTQYPTKIIHFCIPEQNQDLTTDRVICETSVAYFLEDAEDPQVVDQEPKFSYREIVERAQQYIGKGEYDLKSKNCEHFSSWCYLAQHIRNKFYSMALLPLLLSHPSPLLELWHVLINNGYSIRLLYNRRSNTIHNTCIMFLGNLVPNYTW